MVSSSHVQLLRQGSCAWNTTSIASKYSLHDKTQALQNDAQYLHDMHSVVESCARMHLKSVRSPGMGMPGFQPLGMLGILRLGDSVGARTEA